MNSYVTSQPRSYFDLWRAVPRYLGFLLPIIFLCTTVPVIILTLVSVGAGLLVITVGVFFLLGGLFLAKGFGNFELLRLKTAGMNLIDKPSWPSIAEGTLWQRTKAIIVGPDYWRYFAFSFVYMIVGPVTWSIALMWSLSSILLPGYMITWLFNTQNPENENLGALLFRAIPGLNERLPFGPTGLDFTLYTILNIIFLATLPYVLHGLTSAHQGIAQWLLSRRQVTLLQSQVDDLASSRAAATSAEGRALKRLERDIHDGPQQQLLRLQMDLEAAERRLADDPDAAADLIAEARQRSQDTLSELRQLSKGIAPPLLQDRGLIAALQGLSERNTVPTELAVSLPSPIQIDEAIEQNAYFVVSELYANALKHSGATHIQTQVGLDPHNQELLWLQVQDNGAGGAHWKDNGGLAGLHERLHGLGGTMDIHSPEGGPTTISVSIPLQ